MTRRPSGPPERPRPFRRRSSLPLHLLGALVAVALVAAACIGGQTAAPTPSPAASIAAASPSASSTPSASVEPTASPDPSASPSESAEGSEDPSTSGATSEVCSGTADNREFFEGAAAGLGWPVYCAVLPARWNVTRGSWSGGNGGTVDIAYAGPNGATLALQQGAFCAAGGDCVPPGTPSGDATFGDQTGALVSLDDGGWAIVVDRGANPSWLVTGQGMDEATFRSLAAGLARLD